MRFAKIRQTFLKGEEIPNDLVAKPRILADTKRNRYLTEKLRDETLPVPVSRV